MASTVKIIGLKDVVRRSVDVPTEHGTFRVYAISARSVAALVSRFPIVRKLISGKTKEEDFSFDSLIALAPELVSVAIAAGMDAADDPEAVALADGLDVGTQAALFSGVVEASLPGGITPFVETLTKLMDAAVGGGGGASVPSGEAPDTK